MFLPLRGSSLTTLPSSTRTSLLYGAEPAPEWHGGTPSTKSHERLTLFTALTEGKRTYTALLLRASLHWLSSYF